MLSYPDFEEKQIIIIQSKDVKNLSTKNGNLCIKENEKIVNQVSLAKIFAIFIHGNVTLSTVLIERLTQNGITIALLKDNFDCQLVIGSETEGNTILRQKQYSQMEDLSYARWIVKLKGERQLKNVQKLRTKSIESKQAIQTIKGHLMSIEIAPTIGSLLAFEGNISKTYFPVFFNNYAWKGRKPRTKIDEINVLLDLGYTLLFHFIESNLRLYGFDIYKGFYHQTFYQRKSLVCDIMEVFRPIIDESIRSMINLKVYSEKDFKKAKGVYAFKKDCSTKYKLYFLRSIMKNKKDIFYFIQGFYRALMKNQKDLLPQLPC